MNVSGQGLAILPVQQSTVRSSRSTKEPCAWYCAETSISSYFPLRRRVRFQMTDAILLVTPVWPDLGHAACHSWSMPHGIAAAGK